MSDDPGSTPPTGGSLPPPPPPPGAVPPPPPGAAPPLPTPGGPLVPPPPTGGAWPTATDEPPSGSRTGYIIGAVIAALAIIGIAAFFLTRDGDDESVSGDSGAPSEVADPTSPDDGATEDTVDDESRVDVTVGDDTSRAPTELTLPDQTAGERGGEIPPPTEEPTGLGDDAELNGLANDCYDGDMDACDLLFNRSEAGSDYERYGDTCAGRQEADTLVYCTVTFPSD